MDNPIKKQIYELKYQTIGFDCKSARPHHDNSVEILQFWSGDGHFIVRNNIFPILPGSVILVNALETHYSNPANVEKYNRSKIILSTECFQQICALCGFTELLDRLMQRGGAMFFLPPSQNGAQLADSLFKEASDFFSNNREQPFALAEILARTIRILSILVSVPQTTVTVTGMERTLQLMTEYINSRISSWENITLSHMCDTLHISASYAAHLFKTLTNKSVARYTMDLRLSEAKKLLLHTNLKVQDISELLKFKDCTTFCKTFKKYMGCTPMCYRNSNGNITTDLLKES